MSRRSLRRRIVLMRVAGVVLPLIGLAIGWYWFYYLGPLRRIYDPSWYRQRSKTAYWEECQKCIRRSRWYHNAGSDVGRFGDKQWCEWIMNHIQPREDISSCFAGHKSSALRKLTNQDAGDTAEAWLAWWERNKSKTQEDWIREGFRKYGIEIEKPLTRSNVIALLKMTPSLDEEKSKVPSYVQYNAFRWLRDSDFDPATFTVEDLSSPDGDEVLQGLIRFSRLSGVYPKYEGLGVLRLGKPPEESHLMPEMATLKFRLMMDALIFGPVCIGALLFWMSFRLRRRE